MWDGLDVTTAPDAITPRQVDIERERGVNVTWDDGHVSTFSVQALRVNCPCAKCRGLRDQGQVVWPAGGAPEPLRIESAEHVGNWGLNLHWNDGHTTGIYTWETLRSWCRCEECAEDS
jgi:DUF971 family protein